MGGHETGWGVEKVGERWGRAGERRKEGGGVCSGGLVSEFIPLTGEAKTADDYASWTRTVCFVARAGYLGRPVHSLLLLSCSSC